MLKRPQDVIVIVSSKSGQASDLAANIKSSLDEIFTESRPDIYSMDAEEFDNKVKRLNPGLVIITDFNLNGQTAAHLTRRYSGLKFIVLYDNSTELGVLACHQPMLDKYPPDLNFLKRLTFAVAEALSSTPILY